MCHTAAAIFSDRDGAVPHAPPLTSSTGVTTIKPVSGRCCTVYGAPSSHVTACCNDWSRRALCCLDLVWVEASLPLSPLPGA